MLDSADALGVGELCHKLMLLTRVIQLIRPMSLLREQVGATFLEDRSNQQMVFQSVQQFVKEETDEFGNFWFSLSANTYGTGSPRSSSGLRIED